MAAPMKSIDSTIESEKQDNVIRASKNHAAGVPRKQASAKTEIPIDFLAPEFKKNNKPREYCCGCSIRALVITILGLVVVGLVGFVLVSLPYKKK